MQSPYLLIPRNNTLTTLIFACIYFLQHYKFTMEAPIIIILFSHAMGIDFY